MLFLGQECYFKGRNVILGVRNVILRAGMLFGGRNVVVGAGILFWGLKCCCFFGGGGGKCCFGSHSGRNTMRLPEVLMFRER